jgi:seryl-tRNA synthetase
VLPSAACYNIYLHLQHTQLSAPRYITTIASCFRNEQEYVGLKRLWGFSMREIVCVGPRDAVAAHIGVFKTRISELTRRLGIPVEIQVAADPFFQPAGADAAQGKARAVAAQLFPTKEEFVHRGSVAIASVNFHRNFFGERCQIRTADEQFAFTGCVAFGVERWLQALLEVFRDDARAATAAIRALTPAETART